jgi:hypothetical protein
VVFRGYLQWDAKLHIWNEDEWPVEIYKERWLARRKVEEWGEGKPFDNNREMQITRYFRKRSTMAEQGQEITEGDPAICEKVWLRFAEFEVKGEDENDS